MKARLQQDLRDAMKGQDALRRDTVRFVLAAIQNEEVAQRHDIDDIRVLRISSSACVNVAPKSPATTSPPYLEPRRFSSVFSVDAS